MGKWRCLAQWTRVVLVAAIPRRDSTFMTKQSIHQALVTEPSRGEETVVTLYLTKLMDPIIIYLLTINTIIHN